MSCVLLAIVLLDFETDKNTQFIKVIWKFLLDTFPKKSNLQQRSLIWVNIQTEIVYRNKVNVYLFISPWYN